MTNLKSILTIYPDSKKSLSTINLGCKEKPLTFQDKQTIPIYKKNFLTTFPDSHKSSSINESLLIEEDTDVIMCTRCGNFPSIFKIYKQSDPFPIRWLNYYNNKDDYTMCYHKIWKGTRYECNNCVAKYQKYDKLIFELL